MTPADAARLWLDGDREGCREWCLYGEPQNASDVEPATARTAAVALELSDRKPSKRVPCTSDRTDFLNYMAGRADCETCNGSGALARDIDCPDCIY